MKRLHADNIIPAYPCGYWSWNEKIHKIQFEHVNKEVFQEEFDVKSSSGFHFKPTLNQMEEVIYMQEFARPESTADPDVIIIQDIKNLVLFLAPSEILTNKFISFLHTKSVDYFLNALIVYFEYFIRLVEFILISRDVCSGKLAQLESTEALDIRRIYAEYLTQYRIILAREYSVIITGNGDMKPYYHVTPVTNISKSAKDKVLHESFLAICTQIVWIAHHRRGYNVIDWEMNRLFRSHHFLLTRKDPIEFTHREQELLFGPNDHRVNSRYQKSPVIQELASLAPRNLPLLWIGHKKYHGNDPRMQELEMEILVPESQLLQVDVSHGILGHPKKLYNTLLTIMWDVVREQGYSDIYDPYRVITQPHLVIPDLNTLKKNYKHFESHFSIKDNRFEYVPDLIHKWKRRDKVIAYIMGGGRVYDIVEKCRKDIEETKKRNRPSSMETTAEFLAYKKKWLKFKKI